MPDPQPNLLAQMDRDLSGNGDPRYYLRKRAAEIGVDPDFAERIAHQESGFNLRARSPKGAMGVMQLMPATSVRHRVKNPWDARQNIDGGLAEIRRLHDKYDGDQTLVAVGYNAGEGAADRYRRGGPIPRETQGYIKAVKPRSAILDRMDAELGGKELSAAEQMDRDLGGKKIAADKGASAASGAAASRTLAAAPNQDEQEFRRWYGERARRLNLNPNPDDPRHHYDYRAAHRAGAEPGPNAHWPSEFKSGDRPNRYLTQNGQVIDTITGKEASQGSLDDQLRRNAQVASSSGVNPAAGPSSHAASPSFSNTSKIALGLETAFEELKREGDIEGARRYAAKLKDEGWETGESEGWPYVKPPAGFQRPASQGTEKIAAEYTAGQRTQKPRSMTEGVRFGPITVPRGVPAALTDVAAGAAGPIVRAAEGVARLPGRAADELRRMGAVRGARQPQEPQVRASYEPNPVERGLGSAATTIEEYAAEHGLDVGTAKELAHAAGGLIPLLLLKNPAAIGGFTAAEQYGRGEPLGKSLQSGAEQAATIALMGGSARAIDEIAATTAMKGQEKVRFAGRTAANIAAPNLVRAATGQDVKPLTPGEAVMGAGFALAHGRGGEHGRAGERSSDVGSSPTAAPHQTVPEAPATIDAQMESLVAGRKQAVLIPRETEQARRAEGLPPIPELPEGHTTTRTAVGTFIHPKTLSHAEVRAKVRDDSYGEFLGNLERKSDAATETVVARGPQGEEIQAANASPENVPAQAAKLQRQYPQASVRPEPAERVIAARQVEPMIPRDEPYEQGLIPKTPSAEFENPTPRKPAAMVANPRTVEEISQSMLPEPQAKEPWQMTREEHRALVGEYNAERYERINTGDENRLSMLDRRSGQWQAYTGDNPSLRNSPDTVIVYRAGPTRTLNAGDFIYLNRRMAQAHLREAGEPGWRITEREVPLDHIVGGQDSTEFVFSPRNASERTHREAVTAAVASGKFVPAETLVDYPDLKPSHHSQRQPRTERGEFDGPPKSEVVAAMDRERDLVGEGTTIPTDRASFKAGIVKHWGYSEDAAESSTAVADALVTTLAAESGQTKETWYKQIWISSAGKGEGLEQAPTTLEFKRWFGDSKVVDEKGEPLVVYHGSDRSFDTFKRGEVLPIGGVRFGDAQGFYFSDSPEYASKYGDIIMPTYLSIKNPYIVPEGEFDHTYISVTRREKLEALGFDGVIAEGRFGEFIPFEPTQIKSAIGNRGTYDPNDPSILKQGPRGMTSFLRTGQAVIRALQNPNESTAVHEIHHALAPEFMNLADSPEVSDRFRADMDHMSRWMGLKDPGEFNALHEQYAASTLKGRDLKRYVDGQEKAARGFEKYLRTGKAPTPALEAVFARFKEWLTNIYQNLKGSAIDIRIGPKQTAVWDRMLGADDAKATAILEGKERALPKTLEEANLPPDTTGIARRVEEARRGREIPDTGGGMGAQESVEHGREMLRVGRDPQGVVDDFEKTGAVSADAMALVRAKHEELARAANAAFDKGGLNNPEFKTAEKARQDFWETSVRPMQTAWSNTGRAQQGETAIDTGTFYGLYRAFKQETGREMSPREQTAAQRLADRVAASDRGTQDAERNLIAQLNRATGITDLDPDIQKALGRFIQESRRETRAQGRRATKKTLDEEAAVIKSNLAAAFKKVTSGGLHPSGLAGLDPEGEVTKHVIEYAKNRVKAGVVDTAQLIDDVHAALKEFADVGRREVAEALAGMGAPSKEKREPSDWMNTKGEIRKALKTEDAAQNLADVGKRLAAGERMKPQDVKTIWQHANETYIDKGVEFGDTVQNLASDLGATPGQVRRALASSPGVKRLADEAYRKMAARRQVRSAAEQWVKNADRSPGLRAVQGIADAFFNLKTFGHGTVGPVTHAGENIFHPTRWVNYFKNVGRTWRAAYSTAAHERYMQDLVNKPNYTAARRGGLKNEPGKFYDEYQNNLAAKMFGEIGKIGNRGFDVLKTMRQDFFDQRWNKLDESQKTPEMAKAIADLVNHSTGAISSALPAPNLTRGVFFAAPLEMSRWARILGDPVRAVDKFINWKSATAADKYFAKSVVKNHAEFMATYLAALALNQAILSITNSDDKVNFTDPSKGDWLRLKVKGRAIEPTGGLISTLDFLGKLGQAAFGEQDPREGRYERMGNAGAKYVRGKLSPLASTVTDVATQSDFTGRPLPFSEDRERAGKPRYSWPEYLITQQTPIPIAEAARDFVEETHKQGVPLDTTKAIFRAAWQNRWDAAKGTGIGILSGGTGVRVGAEYQQRSELGRARSVFSPPEFRAPKPGGFTAPRAR